MSTFVKGFGCRPYEGGRGVFGGRRSKPFTFPDLGVPNRNAPC